MSDDEMPPLWHYTSRQGLLGIVQEKCMWATNIFYMNDATEHLYAMGVINEVLTDRLTEMKRQSGLTYTEELGQIYAAGSLTSALGLDRHLLGENEGKYLYIQEIKDTMRVLGGLSSAHIYIISFTAELDNLNHWRGYCPQGMGFCLQFNQMKLAEAMKKESFDLAQCLYEKDAQKKLVNDLVDKIINKYEAESIKGNEDQPISSRVDAIIDLWTLAARMKDKAFESENEWRYIFHGEPAGIRHRDGNSMLIPYMEAEICDSNKQLSSIEKVIVGPAPHQQLSEESVKSFLKANKMDPGIVERSNVPYRAIV